MPDLNVLLSVGLKAYLGPLAIGAASHRLFTHRTYKAVFGLRVALMLLQTSVGQVSPNQDPYSRPPKFASSFKVAFF